MAKRRTCLLIASAMCVALMAPSSADAATAKARQIRISYGKPTEPRHREIHDLLRNRRALEKLQLFLSPFRLPRTLTLAVKGCDGDSNAYYEDDAVTVCYEYLEFVLKHAPTETTPAGITRQDAVVGQFVDVFLHEVGHAIFDLLRIPIFGREEDAADQFSAYIMLSLGKEEMRRLVAGAAYVYRAELGLKGPGDLQTGSVSTKLVAYSDEHATSAQRFYNLMCIAYGADPKAFGGIVEMKLLPKERAEGCGDEYKLLAYTFHKLIRPHLDARLEKKVRSKRWLPEVTTRPSVKRTPTKPKHPE